MMDGEDLGYILAASYTLRVDCFDVASGQLIDEFELPGSQANCIMTFDDKQTFAIGTYNCIFTYNLHSGGRQQPEAFQGHEGNITAIDRIGDIIISSCSEDMTVKAWDVRSFQMIQSIDIDEQCNSVISLGGNSIAVGTELGNIYMCDLNMGTKLTKEAISECPIRSMVATNSKTSFFSAMHNGTLKKFKVKGHEFEEEYDVRVHNNSILSVRVSPNDAMISTSSSDGSAKLLNCETGELKHTLQPGTEDWVWDAVFSKNSSIVITGGSDGGVRAWDVTNGKMMAQYCQLDKSVSSLGLL